MNETLETETHHSQMFPKGSISEQETEETALVRTGKGKKPDYCGKPASYVTNIGKVGHTIRYCKKRQCPTCYPKWVERTSKNADYSFSKSKEKYPDWHEWNMKLRIPKLSTKTELNTVFKGVKFEIRSELGKEAIFTQMYVELPSIDGDVETFVAVYGRSRVLPEIGAGLINPYELHTMLQYSNAHGYQRAVRWHGKPLITERIKNADILEEPSSRFKARMQGRVKKLEAMGVHITKADRIHVRLQAGEFGPELGDYAIWTYGKLYKTDMSSYHYLHFGEWNNG